MTTIMVVEDNELSRDALSRRLERRGYRVVLAVDGEQAVAIGRAELPDLVLMDLGLPRVDGWEATRRLKARCRDATHSDHRVERSRDDERPGQGPRGRGRRVRHEADSVPAAAGEDRGVARADANEGDRDQSMTTLLLVDDEPMNRDALQRRLVRSGYRVLTAESGAQALEAVGAHHVDLVLLDVMMPGIDGIETVRRLRQSRSVSELPVIMVTAKDSTEDIVEALDAGANDYVTKPVDFAVAQARIRTQLTARRADPLTGTAEPRRCSWIG